MTISAAATARRPPDPEFERWIADARAEPVARALSQMPGLKRVGAQMEGPCPACGGKTRLWVHVAKDKWGCRHCETGGKGALSLMMHVPGADFLTVCEELAGPPPRKLRGQSEADRQRAEAARAEARAKREVEAAQRAADEAAARQRGIERARAIFGAGCPAWPASFAGRYLALRGLGGYLDMQVHAHELRSVTLLDYWTECEDGPRMIGRWPAMIWAVRDAAGEMTGVHVTYLHHGLASLAGDGRVAPDHDVVRSKGKALIVHPETGEMLKAKKMRGEVWGCAIRLTPARPAMIIGEGVETTATGLLAYGRHPGVGAWSGLSLGGMAELDLPEGTRAVTFLGDGDSDPAITRRTLEKAAAKAAQRGIRARIAMAPERHDFNDLVMT